MSESTLNEFVPLNMEHPPRRPKSWHALEFKRLGLTAWPKEVGFYNAGDNFEVTPEMSYRLFQHCKDAPHWKPENNESTIISLIPLMELQSESTKPKVDAILEHHVSKFGPDHLVYNAAMQAVAFSRDYARVLQIKGDMEAIGLAPNGQTYVNLMLAAKLSGKTKADAQAHFMEAIQRGALQAVMRLDTEFEMWWNQLSRMGSFSTPNTYLGNTRGPAGEGAKPMPSNMWAIWGWDRTERKYRSRAQAIKESTEDVLGASFAKELSGSVYRNIRRQPWAKYRGLLPYDYKGPLLTSSQRRYGGAASSAFFDAPAPLLNNTTCAAAF